MKQDATMKPDATLSRIADFVTSVRDVALPAHIIEEAKKCLVDWVAVSLAAHDAPEAIAIARTAEGFNSRGSAPVLGTEKRAAAPIAALVNGTMSHCLDYDDTHIPTAIHVSGPVWAALLAAGSERTADPELLLKAFVLAFEVATRLGADGLGVRLNSSGWHSTAVLGRIGATAGVSAIYGLDKARLAHALGLAATQAGGLTASFGTMAKPFHLGKTAMDAVLSAQMAENGLTGATGIFSDSQHFLSTFLPDAAPAADIAPFGTVWEIKRNSFKPYAACQLTHAAIDAARLLKDRVDITQIRQVRAAVHPLALQIAGVKNPATTTEGKFSLGYCIALGLTGHKAVPADFDPAMLKRPELRRLTQLVHIEEREGIERTATCLEIELASGEVVRELVEHAFGSIGNPIGWPELDDKFMSLTEPLLGSDARPLLDMLHQFEVQPALEPLFAMSVITRFHT